MTPSEFKQHRIALNVTQKELANKLRLKPKYGNQYIRMIEKGKRAPSDVLLGLLELIIKERRYISLIASYQRQILDLKYELKEIKKHQTI